MYQLAVAVALGLLQMGRVVLNRQYSPGYLQTMMPIGEPPPVPGSPGTDEDLLEQRPATLRPARDQRSGGLEPRLINAMPQPRTVSAPRQPGALETWMLRQAVFSCEQLGLLLAANIAPTSLCVELGGPTPDGYWLLDAAQMRELSASLIVSNKYVDEVGEEGERLVAAAESMPLRGGTCDAVLVSYLPLTVRAGAMREAHRILKPGGLLIWQGGISDDVRVAQAEGFRVAHYVQTATTLSNPPTAFGNFVFQKM